MKTDFFRDKKTIIIICVTILTLTIASAATILVINSNKNSSDIIVENAEQKKLREERAEKEANILRQLENSSSLSDQERAGLIEQLQALQTK